MPGDGNAGGSSVFLPSTTFQVSAGGVGRGWELKPTSTHGRTSTETGGDNLHLFKLPKLQIE